MHHQLWNEHRRRRLYHQYGRIGSVTKPGIGRRFADFHQRRCGRLHCDWN